MEANCVANRPSTSYPRTASVHLRFCSQHQNLLRHRKPVLRKALIIERTTSSVETATNNGAVPGTSAGATPRVAAAPKAKGFTNTNRFWVPAGVANEFVDEWRNREAAMKGFSGFQGFKHERDGEEHICRSKWASIPDWEAYALSDVARRSHLPLGVYQRVPKKGEGFPEDFCPVKNLDGPIQPKY